MQQSTLKRLSEVLGISISTVSRALKDHPDISEKTKTKVKELATALEYEPNNSAVQLRTRQSNLLGILVPTIDNFFYDSFIAAVEEEARAGGREEEVGIRAGPPQVDDSLRRLLVGRDQSGQVLGCCRVQRHGPTLLRLSA